MDTANFDGCLGPMRISVSISFSIMDRNRDSHVFQNEGGLVLTRSSVQNLPRVKHLVQIEFLLQQNIFKNIRQIVNG